MLNEKELTLMGLAEAADMADTFGSPEDRALAESASPSAIIALLHELDAARFAAAQHLQTVETQARIIAGMQVPVQSAELKAWLSGLEDMAHTYSGAQVFTKVRTYLQGCGYLSQQDQAKPHDTDCPARSGSPCTCYVGRQAEICAELEQAKPTDLQAAILRIPCITPHYNNRHVGLAYQDGHQDARHATAELVAAFEAQERAVSVPDAQEGWHAAAEWLRNNYQDFNTIGDTCEAMENAAPDAAAPQAPELTDADIERIADDFKSQYKHGGTTYDEFDAEGFARAIERHLTAPHGESDKTAGA